MEEQKTELKMIRMSEVQSQEVKWLWYPFIPYGKLTIIQGDPGDGKTTLVLNIAARLSKGEHLENDMNVQEPVNVIYQTAEDGLADTVKPRLELAGADCEKVLVIDESDKSLSMSDERLEEALARTGAKVLILDPIQAYLGGGMDMNRANEARDMTKKLGALAEKYQCAILLIGHMNKASGNKAAYRGMSTRVSLKGAMKALGFTGTGRNDTESMHWVQAEKEYLAELMRSRGLDWKQLGTHEKHLSVYNYEKKMRKQEVEELEQQIQTKADTLAQQEELLVSNRKTLQVQQEQTDELMQSCEEWKAKKQEVKERYFHYLSFYDRMEQAHVGVKKEYENLQQEYDDLKDEYDGLHRELYDARIMDLNGLENMISVQTSCLMEMARDRKVGKRKNFCLRYWRMVVCHRRKY